MDDEQIQNGQDESFVREAAKAVALGAVLGAAVGAVTAASREAAESKRTEAPEAGARTDMDEPEERENVSETEEAENVAETEQYEEPESEGSDEPDEEPQAREEPQQEEEPQADDGPPPAGLEIVQQAKRQLAELTGRSTEGVLGFEQADDGWRVTLEVVELSRTPSSTDVMAAYDVLVDDSGDVRQWRRTRRYIRSQAESEEVA
jgi:Gas vesicle synthesis protein GvpO